MTGRPAAITMPTQAAFVTVAIPANPKWVYALPTTLGHKVDQDSLDLLVRDALVSALAAFDQERVA